MLLVRPHFEIEDVTTDPEKRIERAGRTCYRSEDRIGEETAGRFVRMLIGRGHTAMIEHASMSVRFLVDRGVSHEMVRHRLASYAQESTRFCNYHRRGVRIIIPPWLSSELVEGDFAYESLQTLNPTDAASIWLSAGLATEAAYLALLTKGWKPEEARGVLPTMLATEIVMTANMREWRAVFLLRTAERAHPQMREVMQPLLAECAGRWPSLFDDIKNGSCDLESEVERLRTELFESRAELRDLKQALESLREGSLQGTLPS